MTKPECLTELAPDFAQAAKEYRSRREEAEARVVEWRWASAPLFSLELLRYERGGHRKGRYLKKEPVGNYNRCLYGVDAEGRIVVERHAIWGSDEHKTETFVRYDASVAESTRFGSMTNKPLEMLVRLTMADGLSRTCQWFSLHQRGYDCYRYNDAMLMEIDSLWSNEPHREEDLLSAVFRCEYGPIGQLSLVTVEYRRVGRHPGGNFTCYRLQKRAGRSA